MNSGTASPKLKLPRYWRPAGFRPPIERLVEAVLNFSSAPPSGPPRLRHLAERILNYDPGEARVVLLGGGTGLSTVVGGNSQMPDWPERPFAGLKQDYPRLDVVVCTTDDGGSTGRLLRQLPVIAIGDLRKSCLSLVKLDLLRRTYGAGEDEARQIVALIQKILNYRFPLKGARAELVRHPLLAVPSALRKACPERLSAALESLGRFVSPGGGGPAIDPAGHCLGNLLLTSAVFRAMDGRSCRVPGLREVREGLDHVASLIGSPTRRLHPATVTPGQLKFRYANGVEVYGQSKSALTRRGYPVERLEVELAGTPEIGSAVCRAIREADLIIYAPGSLYTSIIPLLQLAPIVDAVRANRNALKILGANSWVQEGETDISLRNEARGFLVSELIEAYDRNVPGGADGLFNIVLSANLEQIPSNILRNYALEGKAPIHLDRDRVEAMGFQAVEAGLLSPDYVQLALVIHHDARKFALAVRTLLWARSHLETWKLPRSAAVPRRVRAAAHTKPEPGCRLPLCRYMHEVRETIEDKSFRPERLRRLLLDLAWENRDIAPSHLKAFRGARIVPARQWHRSNSWDNVLGYFEPQDRFIYLHERLAGRPDRMREDFLIALGESLLGTYIQERCWVESEDLRSCGVRAYEIRLRPPQQRKCFLDEAQLKRYLVLARMTADPRDPETYRIVLNNDEGFLPSGLLFGMTYAWYLNNAYGATMEYEMSLLRFPPETLLPHQAKERARRQALVDFFREVVFGHRRARVDGEAEA